MRNPFDMDAACPSGMTIWRAGSGIVAAPEGISSGPFLVQTMLSSQFDGEMTAMRAFLDQGVVTHWHSHPRGQLLFVLNGVGLVQRDGGDVMAVGAGDGIWFAPNERHWHGASPSGPLDYLSIQPVKDGVAVHWMEEVNVEGHRP